MAAIVGTIIKFSPCATHLAVSIALPPPRPIVQAHLLFLAISCNLATSCLEHSPLKLLSTKFILNFFTVASNLFLTRCMSSL